MATENMKVHPDQTMSNDIEANNIPSDQKQISHEDLKKIHTQKHMRRLAYVTVIVLLLTAVVLAFALTIMRIRSPVFQIRSIRVENLATRSEDSLLSLRLRTEVSVKNTNFGFFEFDESLVEFDYGGDSVGEALIREGKVRARSVKETIETADLEIEANSRLENDERLGFLTVKSKGKLSGKVHLLNLKMFNKAKTVEMKCTIIINLATKIVHDLKCD